MEKYIESVSELNLGKKIGGGSCSEVFEMEPGVYFKKFNEDYSDLNDPINMEFFEVIKTISGIDYLPYVVRGKDVYRSHSELFGYSMDEVCADELDDISDDTLVSDLMDGFEELRPSIKILSDSFVKTEDIGGDNIMFNGHMYLLDLDLSLVDRRYIPDELYESTRRNLFKSIYNRITGEYFNGCISNDDYLAYMSNLLDRMSNSSDFQVKTIRDVKKVYKKTTFN
ncbi:MAG: hypothetical protein IJA30_04375 [Bacilli bacterium]|nr:hypothetical protein [Bacilli bacterium]